MTEIKTSFIVPYYIMNKQFFATYIFNYSNQDNKPSLQQNSNQVSVAKTQTSGYLDVAPADGFIYMRSRQWFQHLTCCKHRCSSLKALLI